MLYVVTKIHAHLALMDIIYLHQVVNPVILHVQPVFKLLEIVRRAPVDSQDEELNVDEIVGLDLDLYLEEVFQLFHS